LVMIAPKIIRIVLAQFNTTGSRGYQLKSGQNTDGNSTKETGNSRKQGKKLLGTLSIIIDDVNLGLATRYEQGRESAVCDSAL
jgi:hypothetical protein